MKTLILITPILLSASVLAVPAFGGPTKVGNGDDGSDLEGVVRLTDGPIFDARTKAIGLLNRLQIQGVSGLGLLLPETEKSEIYLARKDAPASLSEDQGAFHNDMRGLVFARTFAQPHAATRFFPVATGLSQDQLVALHIHEALHRSLPPSVRENEAVVSAITLSITAPDPSRDRVQAAIARHVPESDLRSLAAASMTSIAAPPSSAAATSQTDAYPIPSDARVREPSLFSYTYRRFSPAESNSLYPVSGMHSVQSFLYPFGSDRVPLGIGIEASLVQVGAQEGSSSNFGPLGLSARMRLWSGRGFDIGAWGTASFHTLSDEELRNSPVGRDVTTLGLSMRKDLAFLSIENFLGYSFPGAATYRIGPYDYDYTYGGVVNVSTHVAARLPLGIQIGGFAEVHLADSFRVSGPGFEDFETGRYRLISVGPEITFRQKNLQLGLAGRAMLDASQGVNYDTLGNLMGQGVGQGSVEASVGVYF